MRILVTGGAGYIGSILVPELLKRNHDVIVIDDFRYKQISLLDCCHYESLRIIRGDCRDESLIKRTLREVDVVIPLAALVGAPLCEFNPVGAKTINFDAVKMILDLRSKDQRIIFPQTNSGYGIGEKGIYCTEDTPLRPISLYSRLKVEIEKLILDSGNSITLRLATVFGISPRMRLDLLVNDFVLRAMYDKSIVLFEPHFRRNFIHVRDAAKAFIHCLDYFDLMKDRPYNVGLSDANLSKLELCNEIKKQLPDFVVFVSNVGEDPDKRNYIVSNERIEKTGYEPDISLQQGIRELIRGYQVFSQTMFGNM
jgi:nucleoside-diphosphate-sugar epimerase